MTTHEDMKSLIAAYVLGAVPDDEMPALRAHILTCEECFEEAERFATTISSLALAVEPGELPAGFGDAVVARATEGRADEPARSPARRWRWIPAVAFVALFATSVALGVALLQVRQDLDANRDVLSALVHSDEDLVLRGPGAVGRVVPLGRGSVLLAAGLSHAPEGHVYQWWLMNDEVPTSAGLFDASDGVVVSKSARDLANFDCAAVTIEPEGGSAGPTTPPVMSCEERA